MAEDYLRDYIKLVTDHFAGDITSSEQYCPGTRSSDWRSGARLEVVPGAYEATLANFLLSDPAGTAKRDTDALVLIGGIGTGKSTTLRELIRTLREKPRRCSVADTEDGLCAEEPIIIDFNIADIFGEMGRRTGSDERVKHQSTNFWNIAAARFERVLGQTYSFEMEVAFWAWALDHATMRERSRVVHRWLNEWEHQIRAVATGNPYGGWSIEQLSQSLERQRGELIARIDDRDLAWYRAYQVVFAIDKIQAFRCRCRYVFLDNIDQLEPDVQREIMDFALLLWDVLRARTIIGIRPLTWERSLHAYMLLRTENHFSPNTRDVLIARLSRLTDHSRAPREVGAYLRILIDLFTANSLLGDLFEVTSGLSIRFAIRNFLNLVNSPVLPPLARYKHVAAMKVSDLVRAFFFGDGETVLHGNFDNLYALGTDMRREYRLVKARILDYLARVCDNGASEIDRLASALKQFGYSENMLLKALNDLLLPTRPLLWSQGGSNVETLNSNTKVALTPSGRGYRAVLFGQLYYDEVCIARSRTDAVPIERVLAFHGELWEQDQEEIRQAIRKAGTGFYRSLYPAATPAISAVHAENLLAGIRKRGVPVEEHDAGRVEYIAAQVEKMLAPRW